MRILKVMGIAAFRLVKAVKLKQKMESGSGERRSERC
jgi:hypothetical protein